MSILAKFARIPDQPEAPKAMEKVRTEYVQVYKDGVLIGVVRQAYSGGNAVYGTPDRRFARRYD
jgi:hypothetical protein